MGYVLVPVPAEFVLDVMRWVLFRAQDTDTELVQLETEQVQRFLATADDPTRALLHRAAEATVKALPLALRDLADELDMEPPAVRDRIEQLNHEILEGDRELIELRADVNVGVHGRTGTTAFVSMRPALARSVWAATSAGTDDA